MKIKSKISENLKNPKTRKKINKRLKLKKVFFYFTFCCFLRTIQKLYFVGFCYFLTKNVAKQQKPSQKITFDSTMLQNNEKQKITKTIFLVFVAWRHF